MSKWKSVYGDVFNTEEEARTDCYENIIDYDGLYEFIGNVLDSEEVVRRVFGAAFQDPYEIFEPEVRDYEDWFFNSYYHKVEDDKK